ncbi:hypothetical protein MRX96_029590 [Rhipicephalus microplus]
MDETKLPQKRYYRQRAHSNPIADHCFVYPPCPDDMDWGKVLSSTRQAGGVCRHWMRVWGPSRCPFTNVSRHTHGWHGDKSEGKDSLQRCSSCFLTPHFKKQKHKWRIINRQLLAEYAYVLRVQGLLYTITDVKKLHDWMVSHLAEHPLFERVSEEDLKTDVVVEKLYESTEEGKKVTRNSGEKFLAVFRRIEDPYAESSGQESIEMKDDCE